MGARWAVLVTVPGGCADGQAQPLKKAPRARDRAAAEGARRGTGAAVAAFQQFPPLASPSLLSPRPQLDEDTLLDLTWAFIAIDLNHSGTIDPHELSCILGVLAGDLHVRKGQGSSKKGQASQQTWAKKNVKEILIDNLCPNVRTYVDNVSTLGRPSSYVL